MAFRYRGSLGSTNQTAVMRDWPSSGAIAEGALVDLSSGLAVKATPGSSAVLGIAAHAVSANDSKVKVYIDPEAVFEVPYTGSSKKTLEDSDLGTAFDITSGADTIDLDDTTDGMCVVIGYDNAAGTALVKIKSASRALA